MHGRDTSECKAVWKCVTYENEHICINSNGELKDTFQCKQSVQKSGVINTITSLKAMSRKYNALSPRLDSVAAAS